MPYQPGIPTGTVPLNQDYLNIQGNFTSLNTQFNVDHVPLTSTSGSPPNGYHTALHLVPQTSVTAVAGYGELFSQTTNDGISTSQQLFYQFVNATPTTIKVPLTRNFAPKVNANGYTFLPGGLILQWGVAAGSSAATVTVTFATANINFPNNCFNVTAIPIRAATSPGSDFSTAIVTSSVSTTSFQIANIGAHTMDGWYWMALGN